VSRGEQIAVMAEALGPLFLVVLGIGAQVLKLPDGHDLVVAGLTLATQGAWKRLKP
jgi:hypothetical protein